MSTPNALGVLLANLVLCIGIGHYALGAPWWAVVLFLSIENQLGGARVKGRL